MKTIIVPTDFSKVSQNAFHYAYDLAEQLGEHRILLLHTYRPVMDVNSPLVLIPPVSDPNTLRDWFFAKFLEQSRTEDMKGGQVQIDCEVRLGFAIDEIIELSREDDTAFVVMGTHGEHNLAEKVFGSITSGVIQRSFAPVIVVPEDAEFKGFRKVAYGVDHEAADKDAIFKLLRFAGQFRSEVHFVNVNESDKEAETVIEKVVESVMEESKAALSFKITSIDGDSLHSALNAYTDEHYIDLLAMATHRKSFFERLFNHSSTKEMALNTTLPLLVLYNED